MQRVKWFFLDDLSLGLTPKDVAKAFKKKGRYVKLVYFVEGSVSEVDTLRPLFELHGFKAGMPSFVTAESPGYDEYIYVVFNSSVPFLLYNELNRAKAQLMYQNVLRSFKIVTDHFAIYDGELRVPEEINKWEFISLLTNGKFYKDKPFKDLHSFMATRFPASVAAVSEKDPYVELQELSFKTLSFV